MGVADLKGRARASAGVCGESPGKGHVALERRLQANEGHDSARRARHVVLGRRTP